MTNSLEIYNASEDIARTYSDLIGPKNGLISRLEEIDSKDIIDINREGNISAMVYATAYTNALDLCGFKEEANELREINSEEQMRSIASNKGEEVHLYRSHFLGGSTHVDYVLSGVSPYMCTNGNPLSLPFIDMTGGISAIRDKNGKFIFINPQLFNESHVGKLFAPESFSTETEHVKAYDAFLRKSFGNNGIELTRPWLKTGRLFKDF
jgi:hypothetical protein